VQLAAEALQLFTTKLALKTIITISTSSLFFGMMKLKHLLKHACCQMHRFTNLLQNCLKKYLLNLSLAQGNYN
jgi:hypothetical protein